MATYRALGSRNKEDVVGDYYRSTNNPIGRRRNLGFLFLLGALVLGGCGKSLSVPSTVPVSGVVKFKGKPLQGIRVTLHSQTETQTLGLFPLAKRVGWENSNSAPANPQRSAARDLRRDVEKPEITGSVETEVDAFRGMYSDPAKPMDYYHQKGEKLLQPSKLK